MSINWTANHFALFIGTVLAIFSAGDLSAQDHDQYFRDFFEAVASGETAELIKNMDPRLQTIVDEPVLAMLFECINEKLGTLQSLEIVSAKSEEVGANNTVVLTLNGIVTLQKGDAEVRLSLVDGKLSGFNVKSEKIVDWLHQPEDTRVYDQGCQKFMGLFLKDSGDEAWGMLHPSLQKAVPRKKFQEMIDRVAGIDGTLVKATLTGIRWASKGTPTMHLDYRLECENTSDATCTMKIQFIGLQGHITGFHFKD